MIFVLQNSLINKDDVDLISLKQQLDREKFQHSYFFVGDKYLDGVLTKDNIEKSKNVVNVGDLDFVQDYLDKIHGISKMNPIEIPEKLRLDKFLCRKYSIIDKEELMTKKGYWFIKYASKLKQFSHIGPIEQLQYCDEGKEPFLKDGLYVFSEVKNILAEYRVFVHRDEIKGIQYYDGDPTIMPTIEEISKIKEMVLRYMMDSTRPGAYTLDVAIIKTNTTSGRDLMLLEIHPFCSVGLYGVQGSFLPYAYRDGLDWYIKNNTELQKFSNF